MTPDPRFDEPVADTTVTARLKEAFQSLEDGTADRAQGKLILEFIAGITGYYNGMSLAAWTQHIGSPVGYETACVEHQAKRWVFSQILPFLTKHVDPARK
jgi:hypothetical protein